MVRIVHRRNDLTIAEPILPTKTHPDSCWCRPADIALAEIRRQEGR